MRQRILNRIQEIKEQEKGFTRSLMRWNTPFYWGNTKTGQYADEINFDILEDKTLLFLFELITVRKFKQI